MARIGDVIHGNQDVRLHPTTVNCYWQVVIAEDGQRLLHLSTFGSSERQSKPKSSQSMQIDEKVAQTLVDLFISTFPSIKGP